MQWELITNIILGISILILVGFFILAIYQWIDRKSIKKVDRRLTWMPVPLILMATTYFVFDKLWILNTRPDGSGEPSFPSTHVMVVTTILFLFTMNLPKYVKNTTTRIIIEILVLIMIALVCTGRVLAGLHWPIDVIGGILFAFFFTEVYYRILHHERKQAKKALKAKKAAEAKKIANE